MTVLVIAGWVVGVVAVLGLAFLVTMRTKVRLVQDLVRRMNRRLLNPRQLRTAGSVGAYASVVHHTGRTSGAAYRTPVVAVAHGQGLVVALPYGPRADWVRNVLAAGGATVDHDGESFQVTRPELVSGPEVEDLFDPGERRAHRLFGVTDFLRMRRA
ncbi:nitroreductase family deazaflavin-dependent oxidoreductase [Actinokineospora fastidiosa]|uniref:nitroreductase family deazaflavin-dependent oxidoreductase n=1 Tax=Actinokineospora fastidiosa TaxID=1816 RepID=UPI0016703523|nr:nitroreductase family deazaflavin-dependent oxidoreductase [Actinokineospora fastidiosa]